MPQWALDPRRTAIIRPVMATAISSGVMAPMVESYRGVHAFKQILREAFFHPLAENRNRLALGSDSSDIARLGLHRRRSTRISSRCPRVTIDVRSLIRLRRAMALAKSSAITSLASEALAVGVTLTVVDRR